MGRGRIAFRLIKGLSHRSSNLGHQRNAAGYAGGSMSYKTGAARQALYRLNSNSTGGQVLDDYEVDMTDEAQSKVLSYMYGECVNAGQEALIDQAADDMDIICIIFKDFNPEHKAQPDESPIAHIQIPTNHPEAVGLILLNAVNVFYDYVESVNVG